MAKSENSSTPPARQVLVQLINQIDESRYSGRFLDEIDAMAQEVTSAILYRGGDFMHNLDSTKDSIEDVQTLIETMPSALFHRDCKERLPIHSAASNLNSVSFVPLLAREGIKRRSLFGKSLKRGGLLNNDPSTFPGLNVLNRLASLRGKVVRIRTTLPTPDACTSSSSSSSGAEETHQDPDAKILNVLKDLQSLNLLHKKDIYMQDLISWSCFQGCKKRFDFFVDWDPSSLKDDDQCSSAIFGVLHGNFNPLVKRDKAFRFKMALKAGMKHFPQELGLLFHKEWCQFDKKGCSRKTTFHRAVEIFGEERTLKLIRECIPPSDNHPILHLVVQHAPEYLNTFAKHYPEAAYLRDFQDRTLANTILAAGRSFRDDSLFFIFMSDRDVAMKDTSSGLYPFMLAASADVPDLQAINYLLKRNPGLLTDSHRQPIQTPFSTKRNTIAADIDGPRKKKPRVNMSI